VRFHFESGLEINAFDNNSVIANDRMSGARLLVCSLDLEQPAALEAQFTSKHYGAKAASVSACWITKTTLPCKLRWAIIPIPADGDAQGRLGLVQSPKSKVQSSDSSKTLDIGHWTLD
jgi:hypothetical protein